MKTRSVALAVALIVTCAVGAPARAATTFGVTKTADTFDGTCDSDCSLREAIAAANANAGEDSVMIPFGVYALTITGTGEDLDATGDLDITDDVTITGAGLPVVDGGANDRIFHIAPGVTATLFAIGLTNGNPGNAPGGAILNEGSLTMTKSRVTGNTANAGGGIATPGTVTISQSQVANNATADTGGTDPDGGGVFATGALTVNSSTIANNVLASTGSGTGGGIHIESSALDLTNTTIAGNSGAGIDSTNSVLTLNNVTIAGNTGAGIKHFSINTTHHVTPSNTIIAGNSGQACDATATTVVSAGYNIADDATCGLAGMGDAPSTDPMLMPLALHGGTLLTQPPTAGSPAVNAGDAASCAFVDERNFPRPQGPTCDIGAIERDLVAPTASMTVPNAPFQRAASFSVAFSDADNGGMGVRLRQIRRRSAPYTSSTFGGYITATATSPFVFSGSPGNTYCFGARAFDWDDNVSAFTSDRCTTPPVDDRSLTVSSGWVRRTGSGFYRNTYTATSRNGAVIARTGVRAKRLAVVVERCPGCGTIQLLMAGVLIKTISLSSASVQKDYLVLATPFSSVRSGTVAMKVVSANGKLVVMDGMGASPV